MKHRRENDRSKAILNPNRWLEEGEVYLKRIFRKQNKKMKFRMKNYKQLGMPRERALIVSIILQLDIGYS